MNFHDGYYVDALRYGSIARFANHSCDPNCILDIKVRRIKSKKELAIGIITKRRIHPNEEITLDYGWSMPAQEIKNIECQCGSSNCRGKLYKIEPSKKRKMPLEKFAQSKVIKQNKIGKEGK